MPNNNLLALFLMFFSITIIVGYFFLEIPVLVMLGGDFLGLIVRFFRQRGVGCEYGHPRKFHQHRFKGVGGLF